MKVTPHLLAIRSCPPGFFNRPYPKAITQQFNFLAIMDYYYTNEINHSVGPYTEEQIRELHKKGKLQDDTLVLAGSAMEWQPYASLQQSPTGATGESLPFLRPRIGQKIHDPNRKLPAEHLGFHASAAQGPPPLPMSVAAQGRPRFGPPPLPGKVRTGEVCDGCLKCGDGESLTRARLDLACILGVGFKKESMRSSVLAGNYYVGCVFRPLNRFSLDVAYCGECRRRWEEELRADAAKKRADAESFGKFAAIAFGVMVVCILGLGFSAGIFGTLAALAGIGCLGLIVCMAEGLSCASKMGTEAGIKVQIERSLMKAARVVNQLLSVHGTADVGLYRFPFPFLGPPTGESLMFVVVRDPWQASEFEGGWYSLYDAPSGYNEKGEPCGYEEILVTNANFGISPQPHRDVEIPKNMSG